MLASHYQGDELLERGVLAELKGSPQPGLFKEALRLFEQTATEMARLEKAYGELLALHQQAALDPAFETAVARILKDAGPFERPGLEGSRYSMVARGTPERPPSGSGFRSLIEIVAAPPADLGLVRRQMEAANAYWVGVRAHRRPERGRAAAVARLDIIERFSGSPPPGR